MLTIIKQMVLGAFKSNILKLMLLTLLGNLSFFKISQAQTAPKYSNEFLSIGVGARAIAMGNSVTASVSGPMAAYWNPACLTTLKYPVNLGLMHASYFYSIAQYDYGVIAAKPDKQSAFAVSLIRFGVDNIPNTLELIDENGSIRFDRIKSFSAVDYAFSGSYARELAFDGLQVGGNVKIIRRIAGDFGQAWGFGIDLAAHYQFGFWQFGLMARDVTGTFNSWSFNNSELAEVYKLTGNRLPESVTEVSLPRFILGAAYNFKFADNFNVQPEIDVEFTTDGKRNVLIAADPLSVDIRAGLEAGFRDMVFFRMGVNNLQREYDFDKKAHFTCQPNIGMGLAYKRLTIDYALTDLGDVSSTGYSHIFSLTYSIQPADKKK